MNILFQATGNTLTTAAAVQGSEVWVTSKGGYNVYELVEKTDSGATVGAYIRWENNA